MRLMMTSAQVVEVTVTTSDNSTFQDYTHPYDQTTRSNVTPGFKPFPIVVELVDASNIVQQV